MVIMKKQIRKRSENKMNDEYDIDIFDPIEDDIERYIERFTLAPELWRKFDISDLNVDISNWVKIKLIVNGKFSSELSQIPSEFGGIYIYSIEPHIIPNVGSYVMYIGKATKTSSQNLRKRVQSYHKYLTDDSRERLHRLFKKWGEYVYVSYLSVNKDAEIITALEDRLIGAFGKPPCNSEMKIKSIKKAVRAFN